MRFQPHGYQQHAIDQILGQNEKGLFLDMGLGKTAVTLTAIADLLDRFEVRRVLVVAPLRVARMVWTDEAAKWDHLSWLKLVRVLGDVKQRLAALGKKADIYLINRENIPWLVSLYKPHYERWPFDMVVLDELSSFKNPTGVRVKALRRVRPYVKRIVGLTGTPTPKGYIDLWAQVFLLDQGVRLGTKFTGFRERYFEPDKRNREVVWSWKPREGATDYIDNRISDLCFAMSGADWLQLPERIDNVVFSDMPPEAWKAYTKMEEQLTTQVQQQDITAGSFAVAMNKLLQMANGAVYDEESAVFCLHNYKIEALLELIEASDGHPVLVFYSFRHDIDRVLEALQKARIRAELIENGAGVEGQIKRWNKGEIPVLLAHPASAGHGLNLQAGGNTIIWFGLPWSLELYQQANARLYRQGQQEKVIIHHLLARGTVEENVLQALRDKEATQAGLLEAVKARLGG